LLLLGASWLRDYGPPLFGQGGQGGTCLPRNIDGQCVEVCFVIWSVGDRSVCAVVVAEAVQAFRGRLIIFHTDGVAVTSTSVFFEPRLGHDLCRRVFGMREF